MSNPHAPVLSAQVPGSGNVAWLDGEMAPGSVTLVAVRRADSLKLNRDPSKVREKLCWLALVSAGSGCGAGVMTRPPMATPRAGHPTTLAW